MISYTVRIGQEAIQPLAELLDAAGIADHLREGADNGTVVFDGRVFNRLRELPADMDYCIDEDRQMWIEGIEYPILPAD